eukprot:GFYU01009866.1.p1 GENE.GFYU01009866.1~~GFYU01009866.1.p1  ORF type:complete len:485 (+),score=90.67 GFYU01009866.1:224-1678(+)
MSAITVKSPLLEGEPSSSANNVEPLEIEVIVEDPERIEQDQIEEGVEDWEMVVAPITSWFNLLKPGSVKGSIFNLVNAITGASVLAMPYAFQTCGILFAMILLAGCCGMAFFSADLLIMCSKSRSKVSYKNLAVEAFGQRMTYVVDIMIALICLGTCIGYNVLFGNIVPEILHEWGVRGVMVDRTFVMCLFNLLFILPLAMMRDLTSLRYTSFIGILALGYLVLMVAGHLILYFDSLKVWDHIVLYRMDIDFLNALPVVLFGFTCHLNIFSVYEELFNPTMKRMRKVMRRSFGATLILYEIMGVTGYLIFLDNTLDNVMDNFKYGVIDIFISLGRLAVMVTISFSYPLMSHALRQCLENLLFPGQIPSVGRSQGEAAMIVTVALGFAIITPNIKIVFGLIGATAGCFICYILPAMFYLKLFPHMEPGPDAIKLPWYQRVRHMDWRRYCCIMLIPLGCMTSVLCSGYILYAWSQTAPDSPTEINT